MEEAHRPLWRHFIESIPETDLSTREVLDFGCNRGGFLRLLHALKPFRHAIGVDIAVDSIAAARALAGVSPIDYEIAPDLTTWPNRFDIAFSYEVIYLLPDIDAHAAAICTALRPRGVYYAVTGCHTDSPLWPRWRQVIGESTNAPVQDRLARGLRGRIRARRLRRLRPAFWLQRIRARSQGRPLLCEAG